jgi:hypothetical protein
VEGATFAGKFLNALKAGLMAPFTSLKLGVTGAAEALVALAQIKEAGLIRSEGSGSSPEKNLSGSPERRMVDYALDPSAWGDRFRSLEAASEPGYLRVKPGENFEFGGKTWAQDTVFAVTDRGLDIVFGFVMEETYPGLLWKGKTAIPVLYTRDSDSADLTAVGIDYTRVKPGTRFTVESDTRTALRFGADTRPIGIDLKSGSFVIGKNWVVSSMGHGTIFGSTGSGKWKIFLQAAKTSAPFTGLPSQAAFVIPF